MDKKDSKKKISIEDINKKATIFYNDYLENGETRIKDLKRLSIEMKKGLNPLGENAQKGADNFIKKLNKYDKKTKETFKHCENFVKKGEPVSYDIIKQSSDAKDELVKAHRDVEEIAKKFKKSFFDPNNNNMKKLFHENLKVMKKDIISKLNKNSKNLSKKEKEKGNELINSIDSIRKKIDGLGDGGINLIASLMEEVNGLNEKRSDFEKIIELKSKNSKNERQ